MNNEQSNANRLVLDFFEEGKQFTEELLRENEQLRLVIAKLKTDNRDFEKQISMTEAPRLAQKLQIIEQENRALREEVQGLKAHFQYVEDENREFAQRYVEVEKRNSDLISIYVASYQLHATLEFDDVVSAVKEVVINLIGTEDFGIYLTAKDGNTFHLIAEEGATDLAPKTVERGTGQIGQTAQNGEVYLQETLQGGKRNESNTPVICIPLKIGEQVTGIIAIYSLLVQKKGLDTVDLELFELLGHHAATALYASGLFMVAERKRSTLEGFIKLMKTDMLETT